MTEADKPPQEATAQHEEITDDYRTTSLGLFNLAEAFWRAAHTLANAKVEGGHADSPVRTLYYHAIELYLKALLRQHYNVDDLKHKFGHRFSRLAAEAEAHGLTFDDEDRDVLALMADSDVIMRARYIRTGAGTFHTLEGLELTCKRLRETVGALLRKAKVPVRVSPHASTGSA
jgi:HEPN domain-containing protein